MLHDAIFDHWSRGQKQRGESRHVAPRGGCKCGQNQRGQYTRETASTCYRLVAWNLCIAKANKTSINRPPSVGANSKMSFAASIVMCIARGSAAEIIHYHAAHGEHHRRKSSRPRG